MLAVNIYRQRSHHLYTDTLAWYAHKNTCAEEREHAERRTKRELEGWAVSVDEGETIERCE